MSPTYSPATHTVGDVQTEVEHSFGDESGIVLEPDDIVRWINMACDEIVARNQVLRAKVDFDTAAGIQDYPLQQFNIFEIESVMLDNRALRYVSFQQAEQVVYDGGTDRAGDPEIWFLDDNKLQLFPVPQGTQHVTIRFTQKPMKVTNNPLTPLPLPDKFYGRIVEYVLKLAHEKVQNWEAAQAKQTQFDAQLNRMGMEERDAGTDFYPFITVVDEDY